MDTRITGVEKGGPAHRAGIRAGDLLIDINGETVSDFIDMQYLSAGERAVVRIRRRERVLEVPVEKEAGQPLGCSVSSISFPAECVLLCG